MKSYSAAMADIMGAYAYHREATPANPIYNAEPKAQRYNVCRCGDHIDLHHEECVYCYAESLLEECLPLLHDAHEILEATHHIDRG